jgi:signal transduction histidine kinase
VRRFILSILLLSGPLLGSAQVSNAYLDLSTYNFDESASVYLDGEWKFYWHKLLDPTTLDSTSSKNIHVPGSWHRQGDYSALGYATYVMKLRLPKNQTGLALYFPVINSAATVWVNGVVAERSGIVAIDPELYKPRLLSTFISLPEKAQDIEIVVQVANFNYFSGGIAASPELGKSSQIVAAINRTNGIENFFAGSLIAMCIYQLILYVLFHRGKPYLWLALICFGVAIRAMIVHGGSFLLPNLFPDVSWEVWKKLEFGSVYAIVALFPLYVFHLFREHAPVKPIYFFSGISILLCGVLLFTPQFVYGRLLEICHVGLLLSFVYAVYSIGRAWKAGNSDARIILFGVLASFPFILAEIMKNSRIFPVEVNFMYLVEMGVLVFLLFQVYLLSHHYAKSYTNLEHMNQNLEQLVEERSGELISANAVKDRLLSVMSHDIKSPLNSLKGILELYNQGAISKDEFGDYAKLIEKDLNKTSILVENILYWTASQIKGIQVTIDSFNVRQLVEENVTLFKTVANHKKVTIENGIAHDLMIKADKNIINMVIRNLLSNGIKFSYANGVIRIVDRIDNDNLLIQVTDQGVGMDADTVDALFTPELVVSAAGTGNEKGTGLGLALCKKYLEKTGGSLIVESEKGQGSVFTIILPLNVRTI